MSDSQDSKAAVGKVTMSMSKLVKEDGKEQKKKDSGMPSIAGAVAELFEEHPEMMANLEGGNFDKKKEKLMKFTGMTSMSGAVAELFEEFPEQMEQLGAGFGGMDAKEMKKESAGFKTIGAVVAEMFDEYPEEMQRLASGGMKEKLAAKDKMEGNMTRMGGVVAELFDQFPEEMEFVAAAGDKSQVGVTGNKSEAQLRAGLEEMFKGLEMKEEGAKEGGDESGFDIYSSKITRLGQPSQSSGTNSILEERVANMKAAREKELVEAGIPARELRVFEASKKGVAVNGFSGGSGGKTDAHLLKQAAALSQEKSKRSQKFQTQAMREYEALKQAKVYTKSVIRVNFPDGLVLEANFSPLERVTDVEAQIKECLRHAQKNSFYLFVRPNNRRLAGDATLKELGFMPRASLQLVWEGEQPEGEYLSDDVLAKLDKRTQKPKRKSFFKLGRH